MGSNFFHNILCFPIVHFLSFFIKQMDNLLEKKLLCLNVYITKSIFQTYDNLISPSSYCYWIMYLQCFEEEKRMLRYYAVLQSVTEMCTTTTHESRTACKKLINLFTFRLVRPKHTPQTILKCCLLFRIFILPYVKVIFLFKLR